MAKAKQQGAAVPVRDHFNAALNGLVEQVKSDRSILAAILCGSLSHDTVWSKSDIDLVLVTVDDRKNTACACSLYADGINVHALLMPRADFRKAGFPNGQFDPMLQSLRAGKFIAGTGRGRYKVTAVGLNGAA